MSCGDDGGNILHLHCDGTWTFAPNESCCGRDEIGDHSANHRIIRLNLHAAPSECPFRKVFVRSIGRCWEQNVAACTAEGEVDEGNCRLSARRDERMLRSFQLRDPPCQLERGRSAVQTVGILMLIDPPVFGSIDYRLENNCRTAIGRLNECRITLWGLTFCLNDF